MRVKVLELSSFCGGRFGLICKMVSISVTAIRVFHFEHTLGYFYCYDF